MMLEQAMIFRTKSEIDGRGCCGVRHACSAIFTRGYVLAILSRGYGTVPLHEEKWHNASVTAIILNRCAWPFGQYVKCCRPMPSSCMYVWFQARNTGWGANGLREVVLPRADTS